MGERVFDAEAQGGKFFWVRSQNDGVSGAELLLRVPHGPGFSSLPPHITTTRDRSAYRSAWFNWSL